MTINLVLLDLAALLCFLFLAIILRDVFYLVFAVAINHSGIGFFFNYVQYLAGHLTIVC